MINPSFEELEKISKSRYEISLLLMKRARLLVAGSEAKLKTEAKKPVTIALDEFVNGKVWKKGHKPEIPEEDQDEKAGTDPGDKGGDGSEKDLDEKESKQETEKEKSAEE